MSPSQQLSSAGRLEVVATPIGNLADLSPRAREVLMAADLIAAEDTRRTAALLSAIGLSRTLVSLHEHNEASRIESLVRELQAGKVIALVSDAGTPLLSDPGYLLVRAAAAAGINIRAIPGASALTAALSVAALPTDRFVFEGFLPARAGERRSVLARLATETRTLVLFEAPHRIAATLAELKQLFGPQRRAVVARELTKLHEAVYRGTLEELAAAAVSDPNLARGEITLLLEGVAAAGDQGADRALLVRALKVLLPEMPPGRAAALAAQIAGVKRSEAYALAQQLRTLAVEGES
ncbi:MAG TPA: 16S rRNA (cytidine(1402)-2'-O)-methyltransferase [Steroidobacteraceae bacterium]|nr:16S rRNA (cytidine(1402)-2'-O)-methyltransferase [Steroidobacteraceae bacterium]